MGQRDLRSIVHGVVHDMLSDNIFLMKHETMPQVSSVGGGNNNAMAPGLDKISDAHRD